MVDGVVLRVVAPSLVTFRMLDRLLTYTDFRQSAATTIPEAVAIEGSQVTHTPFG